jgi:hypothetical protein
MMKKNKALALALLRRALILLVVSAGIVLVVSEAAFLLMRDKTSRPAQTVELVIPAGAAERVAAGEAPPTIPSGMIFVVGDTLLVENADQVDHTLGPLFIPTGSSASLVLTEANDYAYACSFRPSRYFDLTVRQTTSWVNRLQAVLYAAPPTMMFLLVYSFIFYPLKPK